MSRRHEASQESRERILDAAEQLFAERGFVETSLVDVAERSGISRGSIPWHFTNKVGLLMAVVERATERGRSPLVAPGLDGLAAGLGEVADRFRRPHMALLHTLLSEATRDASPIAASYRRYHERDRADIAEWLAATPSRPDAEIDDEALAVLLYGLFIGIHVQWRVAPDRIDLEATLAAMTALLASGWDPAGD
ncbi:MAG: TetR family transcriptional regulator [Actinomycetota bacterium]